MLVFTGHESSTSEIHRGSQRRRDDMKTTNEEADVIMIQQVANVANDGVESIKFLCGDTAVFISLVYHFTELVYHFTLQCSLTMESTSRGKHQPCYILGSLQENTSDNYRLHTLSPNAIQLRHCAAEGKALL